MSVGVESGVGPMSDFLGAGGEQREGKGPRSDLW